jgi:hypothetical protein
MIFKPVWMSSVAHLERLQELYRETSLWRHALGAYRFPQDFPYFQGLLDLKPLGRVPLHFLRNGELHLGNGGITFVGQPYRTPFMRVVGIPTDGTFSIGFDEVTQVERFDFVAPMSLSTTFPFARLRTTRSGELADFLLSTGGYLFQLRRIQKRSVELLEALRRTVADRRGTRPGAS